MRLGLLGLGRIGTFHAETLAGLPAVEELVLSDPCARPAARLSSGASAQGGESAGQDPRGRCRSTPAVARVRG